MTANFLKAIVGSYGVCIGQAGSWGGYRYGTELPSHLYLAAVSLSLSASQKQEGIIDLCLESLLAPVETNCRRDCLSEDQVQEEGTQGTTHIAQA